MGKFTIENNHSYMYKKVARVIPLAMVDNLLSITSCGFKTTQMNISIITLIELKKLEFDLPQANKKSKCHTLHVGKINKCCSGMTVHGVEADRVLGRHYNSRWEEHF